MSCKHRLSDKFPASCDACDCECPTPSLIVIHGELCDFARKQLSDAPVKSKDAQPEGKEEYPGMTHSLYFKDGDRLKGIRLKMAYFRDIAYRIIGNHTDALKTSHIAVTSVTLCIFMTETELWHVKVGNAILNINPEGVMYYFDVPKPKDVKQ